jgi:hypothetical protein
MGPFTWVEVKAASHWHHVTAHPPQEQECRGFESRQCMYIPLGNRRNAVANTFLLTTYVCKHG